MFRTISDFQKNWEFESEATLKMFNALNQESLNYTSSSDVRTLRQLAWHITTTITEMLEHAGLKVEGPSHLLPPAEDMNTIIEGYRTASASLVEEVGKQWSDEKLAEPVQMYGSEWTYSTVLSALIHHQIHHRGQMTVLMRQAGLKVPGIYGPAREEWSLMGMEAPAW